jgi:hypothetical protein
MQVSIQNLSAQVSIYNLWNQSADFCKHHGHTRPSAVMAYVHKTLVCSLIIMQRCMLYQEAFVSVCVYQSGSCKSHGCLHSGLAELLIPSPIFAQILFPIVSAKFKQASGGASGQKQQETVCLYTLLLLCKSFRNNLHIIIHLPDLHMLWLR